MKEFTLIIYTLLILVSCSKSTDKDTYEITGIVKGIPDSTIITMESGINIIMDSTVIIDDKFQLKGKVERPIRVMLRIKSTGDRRMFWLENEKIHIVGEKDNLTNCKIVGSKTQKEADLLKKRKEVVYEEMERINNMVAKSNRDSLFIIYNQMIDKEVEINKKFIIDYPDSYESITRLNESKERLKPEEIVKLLLQMSEEMQSTDEGKSILQFIKLNGNLKVGDKYIDFVQVNTKGEPIRFSEIMGRYTLLEFWSSSCGPCRGFNPELVREYELYKERGFVIINVSLDTNKEKWLNAVKKDGLIWENVSDLKGADNEVAMIYGVRDIPDNFLIDDNGVIIERYIRGDNLKKKLKELFEEQL